MKRQEILDLAVNHAKTMNNVCINENNDGCVYRGPNGQMCLIGSMIKDEFYDKSLDARGGKDASSDDVILALQKSKVLSRGKTPESTKEFLKELQSAHDRIDDELTGSSFQKILKLNLQNFADEYKLKLNW